MRAAASSISRRAELRPLTWSSSLDVPFTDVGLPDSSGIDLAREALGRVCGLKVVIATESDAAGGPGGGWVRLPRPYHSANLQRVLSTIA